MSIDLEDEILQDFLVEAGEILEMVGGELVELERAPDDMDLINSIFRGFHTVKGGAGFLALHELVNISHKTEDVFNLIRQGQRVVDANLMDVILRSLDVIERMFEGIKSGDEPQAADAGLLRELAALADLENSQSDRAGDVDHATPEATPVVAPTDDSTPAQSEDTTPADKNITEDEFDQLLDELHGEGKHTLLKGSPSKSDAPVDTPPSGPVANSDDITEAEFEELLDQLHGKGKHTARVSTPPSPADPANAPTGDKAASDDITDDEFQGLLDDIHGKGKGPTGSNKAAAQAADSSADVVVPTGDEITDDEFQSLLDDIHGKGKGPTGASNSGSNTDAAAPAEVKPAPRPAAKPKAVPARKPAASVTPASAPKADATVRVDTKRLDDIMNLVGELVLARNRLTSLRDEYENESMVQAVNNLDLVTADLQGAVMKTRMQPIKKVFGRFPRVVRDLARTLNKNVHLEMMGEDTDLDKNLVEALADPLVHLVRNSVDHGIELPEVRKAAGKSATGTVMLSAEQEGDHILLTIKDDGAGMDADSLRQMAVRKEIMDMDAANRLTEKECFELIFLPGASTKTEISDVSGRGVGMDVVKTRINQLNGSVDIDSEVGHGTTLSIKVPLTLAILPTLMVLVGERKFALPLSIVNEIFELDTKPTHVVDGQRMIQNRGKAPPLFYLRKWLLSSDEENGSRQQTENGEQVLMVQINNRPVGFVVDQVVGQEEVVIKPLGSLLQGLPGLAGATITGNGNMALILDMPGLVRKFA